MLIKRIFLSLVVLSLTACNQGQTTRTVNNRLNIGVVNYEESDRSIEKYSELKNYLGLELNSLVELEPTYNEVQALNRIKSQKWDLVFAPPGLAAIAVARYRYQPIASLEGIDNNRSVIVVLQDSSFQNRQDLAGQIIALGQEGSAMGYYLPIYNLYGVAFKEIRFAPTAKTGMEWLEQGEIAATALSLADYNRYRQELGTNKFRILYRDEHDVSSGSIVISEKVELNQQEKIKQLIVDSPSQIAASAKFVPSETIPNYDYMIKVIERVEPIAANIKEKPAKLYE